MPHIHTEPGQHDHTVSLYIVRTDGDQPRALLHMHKKLQRLLVVGGHIELDETPWAAAAHELVEESGYRLDQLQVMRPSLRIDPAAIPEIAIHPQPLLMNTHDFSADHFHSDICYFLTTAENPVGIPGSGESHDLRWLTRDEVEQLSADETYNNTRVIYKEIFDRFLGAWQPVPATSFRIETLVSFSKRSQ